MKRHQNRRSKRTADQTLHVRRRPVKSSGEKGAVILLVAVSLVILVGMVGLAIDGGMMFFTRQQVQASADAAAQAGIMDMYNGTFSTGTYGSHHVCSSTESWTPCYYARINGLSTDTVTVDFPSSTPAYGAACSTPSGGNPAGSYICVTVQRTLNTGLALAVGVSTSTVAATAAAVILPGPAPVPIVVTHPHIRDALSTGGNSTITITGGPSRTVQINSDGTNSDTGTSSGADQAFSISGSSFINISGAGPSNSGGQFRSWGPKASSVTAVATPANTTSCGSKQICLGTTGTYLQPGSIITDPFAALIQPSLPATAGTVTNIPIGNSLGVAGCSATCPVGATGGSCQVYRPGSYPSGIRVQGNTAYFSPGLYYITSADSGANAKGFTGASNSDMELLSSVCPNVIDAASPHFSNGGMVVFNQGDGTFNVGSNGNAFLTGPNQSSSSYEGILFWEDRTYVPPRSRAVSHTFGGGGSMTLTGSIYANMQSSNVTIARYQQVTLQGNGGSSTQLIGEIITNVLALGGTGNIRMTLSSAQLQNVRQVALVQ